TLDLRRVFVLDQLAHVFLDTGGDPDGGARPVGTGRATDRARGPLRQKPAFHDGVPIGCFRPRSPGDFPRGSSARFTWSVGRAVPGPAGSKLAVRLLDSRGAGVRLRDLASATASAALGHAAGVRRIYGGDVWSRRAEGQRPGSLAVAPTSFRR